MREFVAADEAVEHKADGAQCSFFSAGAPYTTLRHTAAASRNLQTRKPHRPSRPVQTVFEWSKGPLDFGGNTVAQKRYQYFL